MIAKGRSISHTVSSVLYAEKEEKGILLDKNIISETAHGVAKEFKIFQDLNSRCEKNTFSFVISPSIENGKILSQESLQSINHSFLEKMGLTNHQFIAFVHENTDHKHIHLYVNRISKSGEAYKDTFIGKKASHVADIIAREMGLTQAKSIEQSKQHNSSLAKIKEISQEVLKYPEVQCVSSFIDSFNELGKSFNVRSESYTNKKEEFQGLRFYISDGSKEIKFKASEVDRSLSKSKLLSALNQNKSLSQSYDKVSHNSIAQEAFDKVKVHEKNNYLHCRGIDRSTYEHYPSVKVGDQAVFALYKDLDHHGKGVMCSTISYGFDSKGSISEDGFVNSAKYFQKGLPRGLSVLVDPDIPVKAIVVTESPIDALSHKQIHKDDGGTMYISTCGSLSEGIKKELETVLGRAKAGGLAVTLAFDNDPAGRRMDKVVSELAGVQQMVCKSSIPSHSKDWSQELISMLGNQDMLKVLQKELVRSGQEHEFRKQQMKEPNVMGLEISMDW